MAIAVLTGKGIQELKLVGGTPYAGTETHGKDADNLSFGQQGASVVSKSSISV